MKNIWKVLGIAAIAAAIPVRFKKDEESGKKSYQSLLYTVNVGPGEGGEGTDVVVNFDEGIVTGAISDLVTARKEAELYADDDPEAAVLDAEELQIITNEAQEAAAAVADDDDESDSEF